MHPSQSPSQQRFSEPLARAACAARGRKHAVFQHSGTREGRERDGSLSRPPFGRGARHTDGNMRISAASRSDVCGRHMCSAAPHMHGGALETVSFQLRWLCYFGGAPKLAHQHALRWQCSGARRQPLSTPHERGCEQDRAWLRSAQQSDSMYGSRGYQHARCAVTLLH